MKKTEMKTVDIRAAFAAAKIAAATKIGWSCKGDYRITRKLINSGYFSTRVGGTATYLPPPKKRPAIIWPDGVKVKVIPSPKYHAQMPVNTAGATAKNHEEDNKLNFAGNGGRSHC